MRREGDTDTNRAEQWCHTSSTEMLSKAFEIFGSKHPPMVGSRPPPLVLVVSHHSKLSVLLWIS